MRSDPEAIIDVLTRVAWYADQRRWEDLPGLFADHVVLDYTSLAGGEPTIVTPAELAAGWRATLGGFDFTQHLVSNHLVDLDPDAPRAEASAQFVATHRLDGAPGGELWTLGGHYRWSLEMVAGRWRVASMTMVATWQSGNAEILARAASREGR